MADIKKGALDEEQLEQVNGGVFRGMERPERKDGRPERKDGRPERKDGRPERKDDRPERRIW